MPLDSRVLLLGLQPQARTPYDAQDLVAERRARVEQLREQQKQKQQKEYEAKVYDWAIKSNLGPDGTPDIPRVTKALYGVSAPLGDSFVKAVNTAKKSQAETYKLQDDHDEADAKTLAQWAQGITPENYVDHLDFLQQRRPDLAKQLNLPPTYDPMVVPTRLDTIGRAGTAVTEQNRHNEVIRKDAIEGNYDKAIARWIDAHPELQDDDTSNKKFENFLGQMQNLGAPQATIQPWRDKSFAELRASVPNVLTTPHEREQEDIQKAQLNQGAIAQAEKTAVDAANAKRADERNAALAKNEAETRRLTERGQNLTNSRELQRLDLERKRLERDHTGLSAASIEKLAGVETSLDTLDSLDTALNKGGMDKVIGPIQGRATAASLSMPGVTAKQDVAEFYADVATLKNSVIKAITGAQMSEPEANRIMTQVPDTTNKPEVFRARMASTKRNLETLRRRTIELSGGTAPPVTPKAGGGTSTYTYDPATGTLKKSGG